MGMIEPRKRRTEMERERGKGEKGTNGRWD
jgi:hypothetical protein